MEKLRIIGEIPAGVDIADIIERLSWGKLTLFEKPYHVSTTLFLNGKDYLISYQNPDQVLEFQSFGPSPDFKLENGRWIVPGNSEEIGR